jgi:hypothetical protein
MKKISFIMLVLFACMRFADVNAQRHVQGISAIDVQGGISGKGIYFGLGYTKFLGEKTYGKLNANYEMATIGRTDYKQYFINITPAYSLANINESVYFNVLGGLSAGLETAKSAETNLDLSKFIYGGLVGAEIEIYFSDKVALLLNGSQHIMFGSKVGNTRYYGGGGFRIAF